MENIPRLSRLTAILLKLQTQPLVSVKDLATRFQVSTRTIYRDLISLEEAGVPLVQVEGQGYTLVEGYTIPPVMFTEAEANALIMAEQIIARTRDASLITDLGSAIDKVRSVLPSTEKERAEFLAKRVIIGQNWKNERTSEFLNRIQIALTNYQVLKLSYRKPNADQAEERLVEPFAIYHNTSEYWVLIAWCRLRDDFRNFRLDRMEALQALDERFNPHSMSLEEYVEIQRKKHFGEQ